MTGVVVITTTIATTVTVMVAPMAVMAQAMVVMAQAMAVMVQAMVVMARVGVATAALTAMDSNSRGTTPHHRHFLNKLPSHRDSSDEVNRKSPGHSAGLFFDYFSMAARMHLR